MWQIISGYISVCIMMVGVYIFGRIVLERKKDLNKSFKDIFNILIFSILQTLIFLNLEGTDKSIIMAIINMIFCKNVFKINIQHAIYLTILYMVILLIPDLIEIFFITEILNLSVDFCFNSYSGSIISNASACILFIIITMLLKKYLVKIMKFELNDNRKTIILSIITFLCILLFFYNIAKELEIVGSFNSRIFMYLSTVCVLIFILYNMIKQALINAKLTKEYDQLLEFMTTYEEEVENQRTLRHETKNEFLAVRAKICDKEKKSEIINYIDEILGDTYSVKNEKYAKFGYLPANGIKGLCYFKVQKAEELGINVSINISKKIKKSTIFELDLKQQREFAKILGVFIDNAIEASSESKDKELGIEAYSNLENEFRMIISNTYNNAIDEEKIGKERFSTKGKNRGHGLLLVNQIVQKNNIFETKRNIKNDIYSQTIIVRKP
mgnify:CR=1 FL=1